MYLSSPASGFLFAHLPHQPQWDRVSSSPSHRLFSGWAAQRVGHAQVPILVSPASGFLFAHLPHQPQWEARLWRSVKVSKQPVRHLTLLLLTQASNLLHNLLQLFARWEPLLSGSSQRPASCLLFLTQVSNLLHTLPHEALRA